MALKMPLPRNQAREAFKAGAALLPITRLRLRVLLAALQSVYAYLR